MLIGIRILKLRTQKGDIDVPVRLFAPVRENDNAWFCDYEIGWPEGTRKSRAGGVDALQAIYLAMQIIGCEIYTSDYHKSGALYFEKPSQGYGFPVTTTLRDLLIGEDKIYF